MQGPGLGLTGASKGNAKTSNAVLGQRPAPIVPWGTIAEYRTDSMPGLEQASWSTINPKSGQTLVQGSVNRVLKILDDKQGGFRYLGGWTKAQVLSLIESWVRETWTTPWAMLQTIPEAEEEIGFLFVSWLLGWNLTFGGKAWQPCAFKRRVTESSTIGTTYEKVPTGYVWDPYRRTCVKAGTQILSNGRASR